MCDSTSNEQKVLSGFVLSLLFVFNSATGFATGKRFWRRYKTIFFCRCGRGSLTPGQLLALLGGTFAAPVCYATNSTSVSVDVLSPFRSARQVHTFVFCFFAVPNIGACRSIRTVHLHNRLIVHRYLFHHFCFGCENVWHPVRMFAPTCFSDHAVRKVDIELLFFFPSHLLLVELLPKPNDFWSVFPFFSHFFCKFFAVWVFSFATFMCLKSSCANFRRKLLKRNPFVP